MGETKMNGQEYFILCSKDLQMGILFPEHIYQPKS